jgi:hypothetical protein
MKGGKRLSEEERIELLDCISAMWLGDSYDAYMHARAILERDDEPEFCTCGEDRISTYAVLKCSLCGKPVEEE